MTHLKKGDKAPNFAITNQLGDIKTLNSYKGHKLAIYFYPKDNTPGCTAQSCNLSENYTALQKLGYTVLGVSADTEKKHQNFINKYDLQFDLLADTEKEMLNAYGVWGPKKFMGRTYDGIHRITFLIDEDGKIEHIINKVKTKSHYDQIVELVSA